MSDPYLIVACDGGGVRGLLSALLLQELDRRCRVLARADLFAGTSAGGLLALGLAGGVGIGRLIDLFRTESRAIFAPPDRPLTRALGLSAAAAAVQAGLRQAGLDADLSGVAVERLVAPKYPTDGLRAAVGRVFPNDPLLSGLPRSALVTTLRLDGPAGWEPVPLHNLGPAGGADPVPSHVVDAALSTTAAPTYFAPHRHPDLGYCVDGGVFANSPGGLAVATAAAAGRAVGRIALLSVGTGAWAARLPLDRLGLPAGRMGVLPWMWPQPVRPFGVPDVPLLTAVLDGTAACDRLVCRGLLGDRYHRVQVPLADPVELDDAAAVPRLERAAQDYFRTQAWEATVRWAAAHVGG